MSKTIELPVLPLKDLIVFPKTNTSIIIGRNSSMKAVNKALESDHRILTLTQKDSSKDDVSEKDLYKFGTESVITQMTPISENLCKIQIEGLNRVKVRNIELKDGYYKGDASVISIESKEKENSKISQMVKTLSNLFHDYLEVHPEQNAEFYLVYKKSRSLEDKLNNIAATIFLSNNEKINLLKEKSNQNRIELLTNILLSELEILDIQKNVADNVRSKMVKEQKTYLINEQIRLLKEELGENDENYSDIDKYEERFKKAGFPKSTFEKAMEELRRLKQMPSFSPETTVTKNYLDWLVALPWKNEEVERINLINAKEQLDKDHFGLDTVKDRILDYLAVLSHSDELKSPILCLIGPPGVGKTSLGSSVAKAMKREFIRISLGGVKDEAEIRGHRKTYIGAMPGKIIQAMKKAKTKSPVILLDEIDKMSSDFRGDPASALLEVLDPEQNHTFVDHFIEIEYDLSKVLFITTANYYDGIPEPLMDRLEKIEIHSYLEFEKFQIAKSHLIPEILKQHNMTKTKIRMNDTIIKHMIEFYTREAGVRQLKNSLNTIIRKCTRQILENPEQKSITVNKEKLVEFLGQEKYKKQMYKTTPNIGVAIGLAWTASGGDLLPIEVTLMPGKEKIHLTGKLGDVMKESAQIAISYIRANASQFNINPDFLSKNEIHIHVPEGAIPKDGPSAGITLTVALLSSLLKKKPNRIAMTGEITLNGHVLAIGGLKEKLMSATRFGIETVIIPKENINDLNDVDDSIKMKLKIHPVNHFSEIPKIIGF